MKTEGQLNISINIECPHCEEDIDLLDDTMFPHLNEEGFLYVNVLGDSWGCKDLNKKISCPDCKKEILIGEIHW